MRVADKEQDRLTQRHTHTQRHTRGAGRVGLERNRKEKKERNRKRPGDEGRHERVRVRGLEGSEEGPHVPNVRPTQITWW